MASTDLVRSIEESLSGARQRVAMGEHDLASGRDTDIVRGGLDNARADLSRCEALLALAAAGADDATIGAESRRLKAARSEELRRRNG
jgi:hypothetical protein